MSKLTTCKYCNKTYPKAAMETKDYCSNWCLVEIKPYSVTEAQLKTLVNKVKKGGTK